MELTDLRVIQFDRSHTAQLFQTLSEFKRHIECPILRNVLQIGKGAMVKPEVLNFSEGARPSHIYRGLKEWDKRRCGTYYLLVEEKIPIFYFFQNVTVGVS